MPTLTFTHADVTTTFNQWESGLVPVLVTNHGPNIPVTLEDISFGNFNVGGIASDINVINPAAGFQVDSTYIKVGTIDFVSRIPSTARITRVVNRTDVSCNVQLTVTGTESASGFAKFDLPSEFQTEPPAIHFNQGDSTLPVNVLKIANYTAPESETTFDYTGGIGYISRTLLISNHGTPQHRLISDIMTCSGNSFTIPGTAILNFNLSIDYWELRVTYDMPPTQWTLSHSTTPLEPTDPGPPVVPGSTVTITSPGGGDDSLDLSQITSIRARYIDGSTIDIPEFISFSPILLEFTAPAFDIGQPILVIEVFSTQFAGSLPLGSLPTIYFLSASGLYQLDFDATHDTLYIEEDLPNTIDVKIPNPTVKTGFIDG